MLLMEVIYITELLRYLLFFQGVLKLRIQRYYMIAVGCGAFTALLAFGQTADGWWALRNIACAAAAALFMLEGKWSQRCSTVILVVMLLRNATDLCIYILMNFVGLFRTEPDISRAYELYYLSANLLVILLLVCGIGLQRLLADRISWSCPLAVTDRLGTGLVVLLVLAAAALNMSTSYLLMPDSTELRKLLNVFVYCGNIFILAMASYIYNRNARLHDDYEAEQLLKESQKGYYEVLLAKEEDTRRFRHDMSNHIVCLHNLLEKGDYEGAQNYIDGLQERLLGKETALTDAEKPGGKTPTVYITGNRILDAMLNFYSGQLGDSTEIRVYGRAAGAIQAEDTQLCSIFSNLIKNAVEELQAYSFKEPFLHIKISNGRLNVMIEIENASSEKTVKNGLVKTNKKDKKNHGLGLKNVRSTVESLHGQFELQCGEGSFRAVLYLPLVQTE